MTHNLHLYSNFKLFITNIAKSLIQSVMMHEPRKLCSHIDMQTHAGSHPKLT